MNYKPDESILIAYLYGELDAKENEQLQQFFREHPEELKKLQELKNVRGLLGMVKDKEVIAPPVLTDQPSLVAPFWMSGRFKTITSIAASLLVLLVASRLLGIQIGYSHRELRISFGTENNNVQTQPPNVNALSAQAVQEMINTSLVRNNESMTRDWAANQQSLNAAIRKNLDVNSRKVDELIRNTSAASKDQLQAFVAGLHDENLRLMKDYFQLSAVEQKKYVEGLLGDFSTYLQEQRKQDLTLVQSRVNNIEKTSDQFKQETEQILASIISNSPSKKNSY